VKHVDIPRVLGLADFLVQPGADDAFNEYRLPAKLPEFFAMGRPVLLPATNVGRFVRHGHEAWVLAKVDALGIVDALQELRADEQARLRLSAGALAFCQEHFDWKKNAGTLERFYGQVLATKQTHGEAQTVS
jgi:glycosyltransferase involved in cell wall biosynthesis